MSQFSAFILVGGQRRDHFTQKYSVSNPHIALTLSLKNGKLCEMKIHSTERKYRLRHYQHWKSRTIN